MKNTVLLQAFLFGLIGIGTVNVLYAQKKVSELTVAYDYVVSSNSGEKTASTADMATNTIYIKGNMSRSEMKNSLYQSTTIYDANANRGVILKEVSGQKLLIRVSPDNWDEINKPYDDIEFKNTTETKTIAGYKCIKAIAKTKDGYSFTVYYTTELIPENRSYNAKFRSLNGLPLEYELTNGSFLIKYTISSINLNPVPASKFDIPKSGYREMTYDESKKLNTKG
jgi:GLPGLI family protein